MYDTIFSHPMGRPCVRVNHNSNIKKLSYHSPLFGDARGIISELREVDSLIEVNIFFLPLQVHVLISRAQYKLKTFKQQLIPNRN
jgi:hypothetical protein